jgi:arylsulfatase A-like enzyme
MLIWILGLLVLAPSLPAVLDWLAPSAAWAGVSATTGARAPSVLVLVLDTVGADHLSIYGSERDTTPRLARFLDRNSSALTYPLAYAPGTWTLPSHASLFTGTTPSVHGIHAASMFEDGHVVSRELRADRTLAEVFRSRGYRTACIFANEWLQHVRGFDRGFDVFETPMESASIASRLRLAQRRLLRSYRQPDRDDPLPMRGVEVNRRVLEVFEGCGSKPCFVVANYMDAHAPYQTRPEFAGRFTGDVTDPETREARYHEALLGLDATVGELLDELEVRSQLDDTWLVITSDHGNAFGEHGVRGHGSTVYGEVTRIPLVMRAPRGVPLPPVNTPVGLLDVATTLAAVGGEELGVGRDLRRSVDTDWPVPMEFFGRPWLAHRLGELAAEPARAVAWGEEKLIEHQG